MISIARPLMGERERQAVAAVLASGYIASGPEVARFEEEFSRYIGVSYGVATTNGTTALHVGLLAAGVGPGDAVATTTFSFVATGNAILFCGAEPVFVDIDPATYNMSPAALEAVLDARPDVKAVLVVHLFGLPADMDAIGRICRERGVIVVEDCAQAHGATVRGQKVGSFGAAGCFSFYATKNMTTGEGGMVVTDEERVAAAARRFVNHGRSDRYLHGELGHNFRLTDIQAAIGRVQLERLDGWNVQRRENARFFNEQFADLDWLQTPTVPDGMEHVYHQYTVRTPHRDALLQWLRDRGIDAQVIYPIPIHQQPLYRNGVSVNGRPGGPDALKAQQPLPMPEAEKAAQEVLSLPVHPALTEEELHHIAEAVRSFQPPR